MHILEFVCHSLAFHYRVPSATVFQFQLRYGPTGVSAEEPLKETLLLAFDSCYWAVHAPCPQDPRKFLSSRLPVAALAVMTAGTLFRFCRRVTFCNLLGLTARASVNLVESLADPDTLETPFDAGDSRTFGELRP